MKKYKNKLWKDLSNDTERAEFIECGRAWETGIIAKAIENDLVKAYRTCALANAETRERQSTIPDVVKSVCPLCKVNEPIEGFTVCLSCMEGSVK